MPSETLIFAQNITKQFRSNKAVQDLNLEVKSGEIYGLVGPDGAGKTTTIRLLCGALLPNTGVIQIGGIDMLKQTEQARAHIGYLAQRFSLYEDLSVLENIRFFAETRGLIAKEWQPRSMEILVFVGLADFSNRLAGQLSGGMKQKLGLAIALVHQPRILLLDEPTTGVDPVTRQDFWQLIIRLVSQEGIAVLVSTPYMDEAARCTRVGFMRKGQIMVEGTPSDLRARLAGTIMELRGQPLSTLRKLAEKDPDVEDSQMFGDKIHLRIHPGKEMEIKARLENFAVGQSANVTFLEQVDPQLEDVFISLLEGNHGG